MNRKPFNFHVPSQPIKWNALAKKLGPWLPSRGSVIFILLVAFSLVWAARAGAVSLGAATLAGPSNATIAYQGRLADASGKPLTGTYPMVFRFYNAATGGSPLWEETWTSSNSVQVNNGLFNVMLGSITTIPQSLINGNNNLWLGMAVGTDGEMTPRVQLGSVPYAFRANRADRAFGLSAPDGDPADAVMVDADGKVGIGTSSPDTKLDIRGKGALLHLWNDDPYTLTSSYVTLSVGNTNPSEGGSNNWINIDSYGAGYTGHLISYVGTGDSLPLDRADVIAIDGEALIFSSFMDSPFYFYQGGGYQYSSRIPFTIAANGNVGIGTTTPSNILTIKQGTGNILADGYSVYSSRRWKTSIAPIENALAKVRELRGVTFDWQANGKHDIGLIAEEVGQVFPEIVSYEANGQDARSVDYSRLVAVLVEAIKEQQATIDTQQQQITSVQQQVTALEGRLTALEQTKGTDGVPFESNKLGIFSGWQIVALVVTVCGLLLAGWVVYWRYRSVPSAR